MTNNVFENTCLAIKKQTNMELVPAWSIPISIELYIIFCEETKNNRNTQVDSVKEMSK